VAADPLRASVLAAARIGTTDLSAALLRHACRGESIPQLSAMLLALSAGTTQEGELDNARAALIRIGHTSGGSLGHRNRAALAGRVPASFPLGAHRIAAAASSGDSISSLVTVEAA
jgi:hypothetical protein